MTQAIPKPPRTPSDLANELLFQRRGPRRVWFYVALLWAITGWAIPYLFGKGLPTDLLLLISSTEVKGEVLSIQESKGLPVNQVLPQEIFYRYQYDGKTYEGTSFTLDKKLTEALGKEVIIEISSLSPGASRVQGTRQAIYGLLGSFTIAFPLFGLVMLWVVISRGRKEKAAYINGEAALAKKIDAKIGPSSVALRWELEVNGRLYFGDLTTKAHPKLKELSQSQEIPVLYNPADPRDNILYLA